MKHEVTLQKHLSEIRERADRAIEGPWEISLKSFGYQILTPDRFALFTWKPEVWNDPAKGQYLHEHQKTEVETGFFIAHARTDIPKLLQVIEKLIEQRDTWIGEQESGVHHSVRASEDTELLAILEAK